MKQKTALCYSEVFKRKVVKEIEDGVLTISRARTIYNKEGSLLFDAGLKDCMIRTVQLLCK